MENTTTLYSRLGLSFFSTQERDQTVFDVSEAEGRVEIKLTDPRDVTADILGISKSQPYRLSFEEHHSNAEVDLFLQRYGNDSLNVLPSLFLNDNKDKTLEQCVGNQAFIQNSFTEDAIDSLRAGESLVIPVRTSNQYSERAGHWQMLRLSYNPETQTITPVIVNSCAMIRDTKINDIKKQYLDTIVKPISRYLQAQGIEHEMEEVQYAETRQHGQTGCGVTTIYNILNDESSDSDRYFTEDDETTRTELLPDIDATGAIYYIEKKCRQLKESAKVKINRIGSGNEALIRIKMAELIQEQQQEVAYEATQSPAMGA